MPDDLNADEILRYGRQLPVIGLAGQRRLKASRVLCIGAGGLGCPALLYLNAAGVGHLGIIDGDRVERSNLHRQVLFSDADIGAYKAAVAAKRLAAQNPLTNVVAHTDFLSPENAEVMIAGYDLVLDATDNYAARYLINHLCRQLKIPLISASIFQFDAQISLFNYDDGPCYQCLYPEPPPAGLTPNCAEGGVLGVLPGVAGTIQATEAIKVLVNQGALLSGKLLSFNLLTGVFKTFQLSRRSACQQRCVFATAAPPTGEASACQMPVREVPIISPMALSAKLSDSALQLIDVREPYEREICHIGGELIPLSTLEDCMDRLDKGAETVIYCKGGRRSAKACQLLLDNGFATVFSLEGGILRWIETVDDTLMPY